jgi:hypothetical protein
MLRRVPCLCKIQQLAGWKPMTGLDAIIAETARYQRCVGMKVAQKPAAAAARSAAVGRGVQEREYALNLVG